MVVGRDAAAQESAAQPAEVQETAPPPADETPLSALKLAELVQGRTLEQALLPLMAGLDDIPALAIDPDEAAALRQGRRLFGHPASNGTYLAVHGSVPVALVEAQSGEVRVLRDGGDPIDPAALRTDLANAPHRMFVLPGDPATPGDLVWVPERGESTAWQNMQTTLLVLAQIATVIVAVRR